MKILPPTSKNSLIFISKNRLVLTLSIFSSSLLIMSCGNSASHLANQSLDTVRNILPSRIPIATVRSKDLKEMPTGTDRALAWKRSHGLNQWAYVNIDYNPATLPDSQSIPIDTGLLPPLNENSGKNTTIDTPGQLPR